MKILSSIIGLIACISFGVPCFAAPNLLAAGGESDTRGKVGYSLDIFDNGEVLRIPNGGIAKLVTTLSPAEITNLKNLAKKVKPFVGMVPKNAKDPRCADGPISTYWAAYEGTGLMVVVGGLSECRVMIPSEPTPEAAAISAIIANLMELLNH